MVWEFSGRSVTYLGRLYLPKVLLEEIFVANLSTSWGRTVARSKKFSPHQWTEIFPNLIAHAGGTFRGSAFNTFYTNSPEAILQNYQLGHRVFEIDFELTSDGKLAAVHDWDQFGYQNGQALSSQEWQAFQTYGSPQTEARFRTLLIGDLLDLMMEHEDIFIVTDTKITEASDAMRQQFEEIYREAMKRDEGLLYRIIPQLYNEEMYNLIKDIYAFPSFIYTLYTSQDSPEKILNFVRSHEDVRVVTMPIGHGSYFTEPFFEQLHADGKKVYTHTIHTYDELTRYKAMGVDGFYTGLLLPRDLMTYQVTQ